MTFNKTADLLGLAITIAAAYATFAGDVSAATASAPTAAETRYQQDRANCLVGKTAQSQATCLKEAGAALQAAREHDLASATPAQYSDNERKRCEPLSGDDRKACLARVAGADTITSGGVATGGELKETVTVVPGTPATGPETTPAPAAGTTPLPPKPGS